MSKTHNKMDKEEKKAELKRIEKVLRKKNRQLKDRKVIRK